MEPNAIFRFSTEEVPQKDRLAIWREVIGRQYMKLDIEPRDGLPIEASVKLHQLPTTLVTFLRSTPAKYIRTQLQAHADNGDFTFARFAHDGFRFHREDQEEFPAAAEGLLLFNGGTGTIEVPDGGEAMTIRINGSLLRSAVRDIEDGRAYRLRGESAPLRLLTGYVDSVLAAGPLDAALGHVVNVHIIDLVALALRPTEETRARARGGAVAAARLAAIRADVLANLSQARLSAKKIARRQGVSERYVYLLFEQHGLSFSGFVTEERLKRAMAMLLDPSCAGMKISDVAFAVGFGDLTTFNRAFRRHYGDTPRALRRGRDASR